jgi:hypothetical protein
MNDASPPSDPPPRPLFRRLTSWLVVIFAIMLSLPVGWCVMKREQIRQARMVLARDGGHVIFDGTPRGKWQNARWAWRIASKLPYGEGILWKTQQVSFYPPNATDETLAQLGPFRDAEVLVLCETHVTDAGLAQLAQFTNLKILDLSHTQITDAGIVHLAGLKSLDAINLQGTAVTPAGVARLRQSLGCQIYSGSNATGGPLGIAPVPLRP